MDDAQRMSKVGVVKLHLNQLRDVVQLKGPYDEFVGNKTVYYRWRIFFNIQFPLTLHEALLLRKRDAAPNQCGLLIFTVSLCAPFDRKFGLLLD